MKQLTCEMCGSAELLKKDGVFVCENCGTKYSVEEAKKMMVEGTVEVEGNVRVQNAVQVQSLLKLAHSSYDSKNYAAAENFCNQVISIDDKNYEAWKLKGEAINYQISADNPRILEAFNCIMTSYGVLDDEGKKENKNNLLLSVRNCLEGEIDFWLESMEDQRPTTESVRKVKTTFEDSVDKLGSAFQKMGIDNWNEYKINLTNHFICSVNSKVLKTWNTTVGYNYYRESFKSNNHALDFEKDYDNSGIIWKDDDYRPNNEIFSTFIDECDNLSDLLLFVTKLFNEKTEKSIIAKTYENMIFLNTHAIFGRSFKRMVSTYTNGYGAVVSRYEHWELDKVLTREAVKSRREKIIEYRRKVADNDSKYNNELNLELEKKISLLRTDIDKMNKQIVYSSIVYIPSVILWVVAVVLIECVEFSIETFFLFLLLVLFGIMIFSIPIFTIKLRSKKTRELEYLQKNLDALNKKD